MSSIAWLSTKLDDGRIACEACNQHYKFHEGEYGICSIRKVENTELVIDRYGHIGQYVSNHLINKNCCPSCDYKLHGIWS